jgi:hypothetical protein
MSAEQNIQVAKEGYAAFMRGDMPGVLAQLDASIEWKTPELAAMPRSGLKRGHAGVLEFFQAVNDCWNSKLSSRANLSRAGICLPYKAITGAGRGKRG